MSDLLKDFPNKAGRKPIRDKALTAVQKTQRQRKKASIRIEEARNSGYTLKSLFINDEQLKEIVRIGDIHQMTFLALNAFLKSKGFVNLPEHSGELSEIDENAKRSFQNWENAQ